MKVSVSLPDEDVRYLDQYRRAQGLESRSAALQKAVRLLRASELGASYEDAWTEWTDNSDSQLLGPDSRRRPHLMQRGEIRWVDLDPARNTEANKRRPAVIVSNDGANTAAARLGHGVVTVVPMTSNTTRVHPFQVALGRV